MEYVFKFKPELLIIESTVPLGTTYSIFRAAMRYNALGDWSLEHAVHSPIRGTGWNWWKFVKMIGPVDKPSGRIAEEYYHSIGLKTKILRSPLETELGKLIDTPLYGLNIAFTQEIYRMCKKLNVSFKEAYEEFSKTFTIDPVYKISRPVFYPGHIGKECVIPNAILLNKVYHSKFLEALLQSNRKRKRELAQNPGDMP